MAEYVLFIWDDEQAWEHADPQTVEATMTAHRDFTATNGPALRGGNRPHPSPASTSLRTAADGTVTVTDGAFAETDEVMVGMNAGHDRPYYSEAGFRTASRSGAASPARSLRKRSVHLVMNRPRCSAPVG